MARIAGVDIPRDKRVVISLTYIFGIGLTTSQKVLAGVGVNPDTRVKDLTEEEVNRLREYIDRNFRVEGDLRREVALEHQAIAGDRQLPGHSPSAETAAARPADPHQCPHLARGEEDGRRAPQGQEVVFLARRGQPQG